MEDLEARMEAFERKEMQVTDMVTLQELDELDGQQARAARRPTFAARSSGARKNFKKASMRTKMGSAKVQTVFASCYIWPRYIRLIGRLLLDFVAELRW